MPEPSVTISAGTAVAIAAVFITLCALLGGAMFFMGRLITRVDANTKALNNGISDRIQQFDKTAAQLHATQDFILRDLKELKEVVSGLGDAVHNLRHHMNGPGASDVERPHLHEEHPQLERKAP